MKTKLLVLLLVATSAMFAGTRIVVGVGVGGPGYYVAPPAWYVAPPCPGPDYYWTPGYWYYVGVRPFWRGGYWAHRPHYFAPRYFDRHDGWRGHDRGFDRGFNRGWDRHDNRGWDRGRGRGHRR